MGITLGSEWRLYYFWNLVCKRTHGFVIPLIYKKSNMILELMRLCRWLKSVRLVQTRNGCLVEIWEDVQYSEMVGQAWYYFMK